MTNDSRWKSALAATLSLLVLVASACGGDATKRRPLIVVGADGLEWELVLKFASEGALPNFSALMRDGCCGTLDTLTTSISPVVWTSIATGKAPEKHGIANFSYLDDAHKAHLYTSLQRRNKALWNVLTEKQQVVDVFGWWCTFPVEEVSGRMVAQTTTRGQIDIQHRDVIWKGSYLAGVQHQVHPDDFAPRMDAIARGLVAQVESGDDPMHAVFGKPKHEPSPLVQKLWNALRLSLYADLQFRAAAFATLDDRQPFDAMLVYFGVTDVASHMFWRHFEPEKFAHPPRADELADFGHVIRDSYRFVDAAIGELRRRAPDAELLVLSDHGFHASSVDKDFEQAFTANQTRADSGHHLDSPPGVFLALGPSFKKLPVAPDATRAQLPRIGKVCDVLPTLLARAGLPYGQDMDGRPLTNVLADELLREHPPTSIASYDDEEWRKSRAATAARYAEFERKFARELRELDQKQRGELAKLGYVVATDDDDDPPPPHDPKDGR